MICIRPFVNHADNDVDDVVAIVVEITVVTIAADVVAAVVDVLSFAVTVIQVIVIGNSELAFSET